MNLLLLMVMLQAPTPIEVESFGDPTELSTPSCFPSRNQIIVNVGWLTNGPESYTVTVFTNRYNGCVQVGLAAVAFGLHELSLPGQLVDPIVILPMVYHADLYGWSWGAAQIPVVMPSRIDHILQAAIVINGRVAFTQGVRITF